MLDVLESRKGQELIIILFIYFSFADFQDGGSCTDIGGDFGCGVCNDEAPRLAESQRKVQWTFQPYPKQKKFSIDHTKPAGLPCSNQTRSFWVDSSPDASPLAREDSTGLLTTDADVYAIGSGITGVGVAYHLSQIVETSLGPLKVVIHSRGERPLSACPPCLPTFSTFGAVRMANEVVLDLLSGAGATGEPIYRSR